MEGNGRDREILLSILYYRYQTFKDISSKKPMRGSILRLPIPCLWLSLLPPPPQLTFLFVSLSSWAISLALWFIRLVFRSGIIFLGIEIQNFRE